MNEGNQTGWVIEQQSLLLTNNHLHMCCDSLTRSCTTYPRFAVYTCRKKYSSAIITVEFYYVNVWRFSCHTHTLKIQSVWFETFRCRTQQTNFQLDEDDANDEEDALKESWTKSASMQTFIASSSARTASFLCSTNVLTLELLRAWGDASKDLFGDSGCQRAMLLLS